MPFAQVNKSAAGGRPNSDEVRMGWRNATAKSQSRVVSFSISRQIVEKLGWKIIIDEDETKYTYTSASINEGTYEDAGFIMLTECHEKNGYRLGSNRSKDSVASFTMGIVIRRLQHYVLNDIAAGEVDMHTVQYSIEDGDTKSLLIECPDWLRYNPQSVPELPKPEPVVEVKPEPVKEVKRGRPLEVKTQSQDDQDPIGDKPVNKLNRQERRRVASYVARQLTR